MAGRHFDHRVLDGAALTNWKRDEVARSAIENAERLVLDRKAGLDDGPRAGACRGGVTNPFLRGAHPDR